MNNRKARAIQEAAEQVIFAGCFIAMEKALNGVEIQQFLESEAGKKYATPSTLNAANKEDERIMKLAESCLIPYEWALVICEIGEFLGRSVENEADMLDAFYREAKLGCAEDLLEGLTDLY